MQETVKLIETGTFERLMEYSRYCLETELAGKKTLGLILDAANEQAVRDIVRHFEEGKGLLVLGLPGGGKTLIFNMLQKITNPQDPRMFARSSILDLIKDFSINGHEVFNKWNEKNVFFDDLGTEGKGVHFGDRVEVMESFIQFRYELFQHKKLVTHITSNLKKPDIEARYGVRCAGRLHEMTETVIMGSGTLHADRRSLKNLRNLPFVEHPRILSEEDKEYLRKYQQMKEEAKTAPKQLHEGRMGQRLKKHFDGWEDSAKNFLNKE